MKSINIIICALIILCTCIVVSAQPTIEVSPQQINVDLKFDKTKSSNPHYSKTVSLDISNNGNSVLEIYSITPSNPNSYITIKGLNNQQFSIPNGSSESISFSVSADKESDEGTYTGYISIASNAGTKKVDIIVTITYYASIEVTPSTLDFGRVGRTQTPTKTLTIKETLGYKSAENIQITKIIGNNWITVSSYPSTITAGGSINVDFTMIESKDPDHNDYTWKYQISSSNAGGAEVTITAYLLLSINGDFNGNGKIDNGDVAIVAYMVVGKVPVDLSADFNNNGRVDIGDAAKIAYYLVGKVDSL